MPDDKRPVYLVASNRPWSRAVFDDVLKDLPGEWHLVQSREELRKEVVDRLRPTYIFFLHWSWKVPEDVVGVYECVAFHMADLPYGRGGSPLQNLILRGHQTTKLAAFRMVRDLDAGPIYLKEDLSLQGSAQEIYTRASYLAAEMIRKILETHPTPAPQTGKVVVFKRRKPEESDIPSMESLEALYDFIRMLDAEGYPAAFLERAGLRYEFRHAVLEAQKVIAQVTITRAKERDR